MADFYWFGNSGDWSDYTNHWSDNSGNSPASAKTAVPGTGDNVIFDSASAAADYTVTVVGTCNCADFTSAAPATGNMTLAGSAALNVYGSFTSYAGMLRTYTGALTFKATGTGKTITFPTAAMASATVFNGSGGGWTLQNTWNNGTANITLTNGTLNTNGQTVTCGTFAPASGTKTLTLGASIINCSTAGVAWNFATTTGLTFNYDTSTIKLSGVGSTFAGGGLTYYDVELNSTTTQNVTGVNNFSHGFKRVSTGSSAISELQFNSNQTIASFTSTGYSSLYPLFIYGSSIATIPILTVAAVGSITDTTFFNITVGGAGSPMTGTRIGDGGNISGITADAVEERHWVKSGGTGNWLDTSCWSATRGGASGSSPPKLQDTVIFDDLSILAAGKTVTLNSKYMPGFDASGVLNSPTFDKASNLIDVHSSITIPASANFTSATSAFSPKGYGRVTDVNIGCTITGTISVYFGATGGGKVRLTGNLTMTGASGTPYLQVGELDLNGYTLSKPVFLCWDGANTPARKLTFNGGTIAVSGTGGAFDYGSTTELTIDKTGGGYIKYTNTSATACSFNGAGITTWPTLYFSGGTTTKTYTISSSSTFDDIKDDGTAAHTIAFTNSTTQTFTTFTVNGTLGKNITIKNSSSTTKANLSCASGAIRCDYLTIQNLAAAGGATFNAWESRNAGNNTGWNIRNGDLFLDFYP